LIVITGAAGFIGSSLARWLNSESGRSDLLLCDQLGDDGSWANLRDLEFSDYVQATELLDWLSSDAARDVSAVVHLGAYSSTTETDAGYLLENNVRFSQDIWRWCSSNSVPMIYASSAATYGDGSSGFSDDHDGIGSLSPLNAYAFFKHMFDKWAMAQPDSPPFWAGLKFFNVYGTAEQFKGDQASMVFQSAQQAKESGTLRLFKSNRDDYDDGDQERDFIYVGDVCRVINDLLEKQPLNGIFNVGTGVPRTFNDLAMGVFRSLGMPPRIEYFDMPVWLESRYQYTTAADMTKLSECGIEIPNTNLETGINLAVKDLGVR
jgi:ADP-L-glycero-D-manno-heptose 6-epimerase